MRYPFYCPECGARQDINMLITEYTADNHPCPDCGTMMKREVGSLVCGMSIDSTGDFYRKCN